VSYLQTCVFEKPPPDKKALLTEADIFSFRTKKRLSRSLVIAGGGGGPGLFCGGRIYLERGKQL
jgi:hypothetical protein